MPQIQDEQDRWAVPGEQPSGSGMDAGQRELGSVDSAGFGDRLLGLWSLTDVAAYSLDDLGKPPHLLEPRFPHL